MSGRRPAAASSGHHGHPGAALRVAVAVCGVSAVLAPAVTGSQPAVVGGLAVVAVLTAAALAVTGLLQRSRGLPAALAGVVVTATVCAAVLVQPSGPGTRVQSAVALAVVGLLVLQQAVSATVRQLVVCVAVAGSLLLHTVGTAPAPALVPVLLVGWVAGVSALVLARASADDVGVPTGTARAEPAGRVLVRHAGSAAGSAVASGLPTRTAGVVVVSVVTALLAVLLLPQPDGSAGRLAGQRDGWDGDSSSGAATSRTAGTYAGEDLDMRARGDLPTVPVIDVPADSPQLWRVAVLTDYDGVTWRADRSDGHRPAVGAGEPSGSVFDLKTVRQDATGPTVAASAAATYDVRLLPGFRFAVAAPGHALTVAPDRGGVAWATATETYLDPTAQARSYDVTVLPAPDAVDIVDTADDLAALDGAGPPTTADAASTALPGTVTARTRQLAHDITAGATSVAETVAAVQEHLRTGYTYDLDSPVPPDGQDAVDHFLFDARSGFCEHFAAAEVVLLRSLGVPARMATGYAGGRLDGDRRVVTGDRGHAWVEVLVPGAGWLPSDPTPAGDPGTGGFSLSDRVRSLLADQEQRLTAAALVALTAVLGWAGAVLWRRRRTGWSQRPPVPEGGHRLPEVVAAVERLTAALARTGAPTPPAETLAELARRLPPPADQALVVVQQAVYGPDRPTAAETLDAVRALDATTAQLLAEADQRSR